MAQEDDIYQKKLKIYEQAVEDFKSGKNVKQDLIEPTKPEPQPSPRLPARKFRSLKKSRRMSFRNWKKLQSGSIRLVRQLYDSPITRYRTMRRAYIPSNELPTQNTDEGEVLKKFKLQKQIMLMEQLRKQNELSANTKRILMEVMRVQNLSKTADAEMQRRKRERSILGRSMSLLATPYIFGQRDKQLNLLDLQDNILNAGNIFKEDKILNPNILTPRKYNILNTSETNNNLVFGRVQNE